MTVKSLPVRKVLHVKDYGAVNDGVTLNTEKIQKLLDECDGDLIVFEKGDYYTGPLMVHSNTYLYFEKDGEVHRHLL